MPGLARLARVVLGWNLLTIAWGALVRATGSGAGCGSHWPLCNGEVLPSSPTGHTVIEFTHRAMSGLALVGVVALVIQAVRLLPRGDHGRRSTVASAVLIVIEALAGAGLVLFGWVANDASPARGWVMAFHLLVTFLLLAALGFATALAGTDRRLTLRGRGAMVAVFGLGFAASAIAGVTGAIAALGDTLFPALSFAEGLRAELAPGANVLLRLRVLHPFAAIGASIALLACARTSLRASPIEPVRARATWLVALVAVQLCAGALNVALLAPVWLQLVHLVLADLAWLALVFLGVEVFGVPARTALRAQVRAVATPP